jgi:hypothetical protein
MPVIGRQLAFRSIRSRLFSATPQSDNDYRYNDAENDCDAAE